MDEVLTLVALDISGRGLLTYDVAFPRAKIGRFDTELVEEFLRGWRPTRGSPCTSSSCVAGTPTISPKPSSRP